MTVSPNPASVTAGASDASWDRSIGVRLVAGDASALGEVYTQLAAYVYGLARRVLRDADRAEEVVQEVFALLWERPDRFDPERGSLRAYVGVLTHRRAVDQVRRSMSARRRDDRLAAHPIATPPDVIDAVTAGMDAQLVRRAVDELPDEQRTPVLLAYFDGRTFKEVAEILHIPEGTAKSRIRSALGRLASALESKVGRP